MTQATNQAMVQHQPQTNGELQQVAPPPQGLAPTIVPLDRDTLAFYGGMIQTAGLVPTERGVAPEVSKARVMAKIVAGVSYGFDPILSQSCFDVVFNRLQHNANCMEILFRDSGEYDTRIKQLDDDGCIVTVLKQVGGTWSEARSRFEGGTWTTLGDVEFTYQMALDAKLPDNNPQWKTYKRDMLYSKVMKRVVKRYNPGCLRPRTLLGNWFAKSTPASLPTAPAIEPTLPATTQPQTPETQATSQHSDPPYTGEGNYIDALSDDDGVEAVIKESAAPTETIQGEYAGEGSLFEAPASDTAETLEQIETSIEQLLSVKASTPAERKKFLKGRELSRMGVDEMLKLRDDLRAA